MEEVKEAVDQINFADEEVKEGDVNILNQNNQEGAEDIPVVAAAIDDSRGEELTDEQIDHLLSTAHDSETEIANLHLKKKERQPVGFPSVSRSVFRVAKQTGVQVSFG